MRPKTRPQPILRPRGSLVAVLDVGSSKIACFIARIRAGGPEIIGVGHHEARGMKSGAVVDMQAARLAIGHAVQSAEDMAGETISRIVVGVSGVHTHSHRLTSETAVAANEITSQDLLRLLANCRDAEDNSRDMLIHAIATQYSVDGRDGIEDPKGMFGARIQADLHAVTASRNALRNLENCIADNHLEIEAVCDSGYAAALASLIEDEAELGCTVIDMGGGTTGIAVFQGGACVHLDAVAVGGRHVTSDIARGLNTSLHHAERMKTLYGHAVQMSNDSRDMIDVPLIGEDDEVGVNAVPRSLLTGIIQPRLEETFEMVRAKLADSGYERSAGRRVILTGGASQIQGIRPLVQAVLDKQVRLSSPQRISGMAEACAGPEFSVAAGLLLYACHHMGEIPDLVIPRRSSGSWISRIGGWFKENW